MSQKANCNSTAELSLRLKLNTLLLIATTTSSMVSPCCWEMCLSVLEISKEILEKFKIFYENLQWTVGLRRVFQSAAGTSLKAVSICLGAPAPLANVNTILHKDSLIASSSSIGHLVTMICLWAWQWELPCCADCFSLSTEHAKYLQPWSSNAFWNMN